MTWIHQRLKLTHIALMGIFILFASRSTLDSDTFWHMAIGRWILENGQLMTSDPFSFTRHGSAWNLPGWPAQIGMYLLYQVGGPGALNVLVGIVYTTSFWLVSKLMPEQDDLRSLGIFLGAVTASVHAIARPEMFTFLAVTLALYVLEQYRTTGRDLVWVLVPVSAVLANVHPMFYLVPGLIALYLVGGNCTRVGTINSPDAGNVANISNNIQRIDQRLALYLALTTAALFFNPNGFAGLVYPFKAMLSQQGAVGFINEWQSPDFHDWMTLPFGLLIVLVNASVSFSRRKADLTDFFLAIGFAALALISRRFISLFGLVGALIFVRYAADHPWLASYVKSAGRKPWSSAGRIAIAVFGLVVSGWAVYILANGLDRETNFQRMEEAGTIPPRTAVEALRSTSGNLFNSYNYGGYLIWAMPERPVFVDSRAVDLYGDGLLTDNWYKAVMMQPGWEKVLDDWLIQTVFIEKSWPLAEGLKLDGWKLVYQDTNAIIFRR